MDTPDTFIYMAAGYGVMLLLPAVYILSLAWRWKVLVRKSAQKQTHNRE